MCNVHTPLFYTSVIINNFKFHNGYVPVTDIVTVPVLEAVAGSE